MGFFPGERGSTYGLHAPPRDGRISILDSRGAAVVEVQRDQPGVREVSYEKGSHVYEVNGQADALFVILSGTVRIYVGISSGIECTMKTAKAPSIIGVDSLSKGLYATSAVATTHCEGVAIHRQVVDAMLLSSPPFARLYREASEYCAAEYAEVTRRLLLPVSARVAHQLDELAGDDDELFGLTQQGIADVLLVEREKV